MSAGSHGPDGRFPGLARTRRALTELHPRITRWLLSAVAAVTLAAELIEPLGNALKGGEFLSTSYFSVIALILFNAITESEGPQEEAGVEVFDTVDAIADPVKEAFDSKSVQIYFVGFTTETLYAAIRESLIRLRDETAKTKKLTLRVVIVSLNSPMSLPGELSPAPDGSGVWHFSDSRANRVRMRDEFAKEYWSRIKALLERARAENRHLTVSCELRESPHTPVSKLYILNERKVYYGTYGIRRDRIQVGRRGPVLDILDAEGFGIRHGRARLIGWDKASRTRSTQQIAEFHMEWFSNLWDVLGDIRPRNPVFTEAERVWGAPPPGP